MTNRVILGNFQGTPRLRVSRPGFDVLDPNLTNEQLSFDSTWRNVLTLREWTYFEKIPPNSNLLRVKQLNSPLNSAPVVFGWSAYNNATYVVVPGGTSNIVTHGPFPRAYIQEQPYVTNQSIIFTSHLVESLAIQQTRENFAYYVFNTPVEQDDSSETGLGYQRILLGNHPTKGSGLFVSKMGSNVTDANSIFNMSSLQNNFQIEQAGFSTMSLQLEGTPQSLKFVLSTTVTLQAPRDDYPPVLISMGSYGNNPTQSTDKSIAIIWTSPTQFRVRIGYWPSGSSPPAPFTMTWAIAKKPITIGTSASSTNRILLNSSGLKISAPDKNVLYASGEDLVFDSNLSMLYIHSRASTPLASLYTTIINNSKSLPIVVFTATYASVATPWTFTSVGQISARLSSTQSTMAYVSDKNTITYSSTANPALINIRYNVIGFSYY